MKIKTNLGNFTLRDKNPLDFFGMGVIITVLLLVIYLVA